MSRAAGALTFLGPLDDVRIYDRALSPAEAQPLYQAGPCSWKAGRT